MVKRTVTGILMALIAAPICVFSDKLIFPLAIAVLSFFGTYEMLCCIGMKKIAAVSVPLCILAFVSPIAARLVSSKSLYIIVYAAVFFALLLFLMAYQVFFPDKISLSSASTALVSCTYVITGFVSVILLRDVGDDGVYYFMVPLIAPLTCDIFAYFCGRLFGSRKLIPRISPNKTVEGSVGGMFFCTVICTVYGVIIRNVFEFERVLPVWVFAIGGILISIVSQTGDLIASAIKRQYGIKDYGKIFPGHGGVMDRFDSVIATVPIFLMLVMSFREMGF